MRSHMLIVRKRQKRL